MVRILVVSDHGDNHFCYIATTVNFGTQTDVKLLEYVAELEIALNTAENEISELHNQIDLIQVDIAALLEARSKYRNLWMTERRYSKLLEEAGAEAGSYGQARDSECSSPYYRCTCLVRSCCDCCSTH